MKKVRQHRAYFIFMTNTGGENRPLPIGKGNMNWKAVTLEVA
ncbi:MAG: hypothetical protein ACTSXC_01505 [Candidatus Freyarchaeota archaeon]